MLKIYGTETYCKGSNSNQAVFFVNKLFTAYYLTEMGTIILIHNLKFIVCLNETEFMIRMD